MDGQDKQASNRQARPKLTRHRTGTLYRRGNVWWLRYMIAGKVIYQNLHTHDREEAERKRVEKMRPLATAEESDALAVIVGRLSTARQVETQTNEAQHPPLTVEAAFEAYHAASGTRPDSGERTLAQYEAEHRRFAVWLAKGL